MGQRPKRLEINSPTGSEDLKMTKLNRKFLLENPGLIQGNAEKLLELPEKVLQFGTGVLLRGLPDFIIDKANKSGVFNGRIAVVKSTSQGSADAFADQDNLYTVCVRGISGDDIVQENIINTAISRVLTATDHWDEILTLAESDCLEIVISNTTEVGIVFQEEKIQDEVPASFPAKLLAVLYQRYRAFKGDKTKGLIIIPTELISDNGDKLKAIVVELAQLNELEDEFMQWLNQHNTFCNSLVDRIVPGAPKGEVAEEINAGLGYRDDLLIMSEPYALWAISGDEKVKEKLSFVQVNAGAFVEPDITRFKELKLRLLNGTHTLTCGLAYLGGYGTVKTAMSDPDFNTFLSRLMAQEIAPSIPFDVSPEESRAFGSMVSDRFKNPFIEHFWLSITFNYTQKMEMRVMALLQEYYRKNKSVPKLMAAGLAGYIRFMKPAEINGNEVYGVCNGTSYLIQDKAAIAFDRIYKTGGSNLEIVSQILGNADFWETDLNRIEGLAETVSQYLDILENKGAQNLIKEIIRLDKSPAPFEQ